MRSTTTSYGSRSRSSSRTSGGRLGQGYRAAALFGLLWLCGCGDEPFTRGERSGEQVLPVEVSYANDVYPILSARCQACHAKGGVAGSTRFVLSGTAADDYAAVAALVKPGAPGESDLLLKLSGQKPHGGGGILSETSAEYRVIKTWIEQGAKNN